MATEKYGNNSRTVLATTINSTDVSPVTFNVSSATTFPTTGNFRVVIDNEIFLVTNVATNVFTATRAQEGTVAANHTLGSTVSHVMTAGGLQKGLGEVVMTGTAGSKPSNERDGRVYLPTDDCFGYRDTGSTWVPFGPMKLTNPPVLSSFTLVNQGTSTWTQRVGGVYVKTGATANQQHMAFVNLSAAPWTATLGLIWGSVNTQFVTCGMVLSDGTKYKEFGYSNRNGSGLNLMLNNWSVLNSYTSSDFNVLTAFSAVHWLRMVNDGTTIYYQVSFNGIDFSTMNSVGATSFLTPTKVGMSLFNGSTASSDVTVYFTDWTLTYP